MVMNALLNLPDSPSLRSRLIILVIGCVLPIALVSMGLVYLFHQQEHLQDRDNVISRARAMVSALDREFAKTESALAALSTSPFLEVNNLRGFHAQASQALRHINADSIVVLDNSGQLLLSTSSAFGEPLPKLDKAPVLKRIIATGKSEGSDFYRGPLADIPLIAFGVPVSIKGAAAYSLYVTIEPERLSAILSEQKLPDSWRAAIADPTGRIVAHTHDIKKLLGTKMTPDLLQRLDRENEEAFKTRAAEGGPALTAYSRSPTSRWTVVLEPPFEEVTVDLDRTLSLLLVSTCAALAVGLGLAWLIGRRIARSITALIKPAAMLGSTGSVVAIPPLDFKEANEVGKALVNASIMLHNADSARKKAKQAQVHRVIEAAPDPMLLIDRDGIISFANGATETTFGYRPDELVGQNVDKLVPPAVRSAHVHLRKEFHDSKRSPSLNLKRPLTAVHQDGTIFPVEISLSHFQMNGQPAIIANIRDITERKRAAELLERSFAQLRRLSAHQRHIKEVERKRIARDIHDDLGQNLLALKMDVATLHARTGNAHPKLNKRVQTVLNNIDGTIQSVKAIMNGLRPATLELGLYPAVEWQLQQFERLSGIPCKLVTNGTEGELGLDEGQTAAVFRILQEALSNVLRHAEATEVEIALSRDQHGFSMKVADDGKGLEPGDKRKANSFGLIGIQERIHSLGGELTITGSPGHGTVLSICIPPKDLEESSPGGAADDDPLQSLHYQI
jgi:PAS domain S-box-containing protein